MIAPSRWLVMRRPVVLLAATAALAAGCISSPRERMALRQSQLQALQLHQQNQALASERNQATQSYQSLLAQKQQLEGSLDVANRRLDNLNSERSELQQRYISMMNRARNSPSPLSGDMTRRFEELAKKYPEFEFDPATGVSKFHSDILFSSGSSDIKTSAAPLLQDFARIMNDGEAQRLNILVVGHTDDKPISKSGTRQHHPTNWHLSTNRADSVVVALHQYGIKDNRMGAAGYSMYQPVAPNSDEKNRQLNRRVEIFVLAPDAVVAGWDPGSSRN